ncbi:MAG: S8 family peptidase [Pseudomonadota bacterium]
MPDQVGGKKPHLVATDTSTPQAFTSHAGGGGEKVIPQRDRAAHGAMLANQLGALRQTSEAAIAQQKQLGLESGLGLQIQFVGFPDVELAFESLGNERPKDPRKQIEILSISKQNGSTVANVFVPDGGLAHFEKYVADYLADRKTATRSLDHKALINTIESIRAAELRALWTDEIPLPDAQDEAFWWEVWLPVRGNRNAVVTDFRRYAQAANCRVSEHQINFPERTVVLLYGAPAQLSQSVMTLNCVAELKYAKETAEFFDELAPAEQRQWVDELIARLTLPAATDDVPRVCMLDSGVNRGHPLLEHLVAQADLHTVNPAWGLDDQENHGTGMAGLSLYGDLTAALDSQEQVEISHRLESVKLIPVHGGNDGESRHHGYLFAEAVSRPEIAAPTRPRVFASAVTSADGRDRGRPSAWSATVDRLASDYDGNGEFPRLFVLAAGNTVNPQEWTAYPQSLSTSDIRDPSQSWNALTVGAYTRKVHITEPDAAGYQPVAADGGLSPYTTTSATWESAWPLKPDVVFEGGNAGRDQLGAIGIRSLHLLSTNNAPVTRLLTTMNATSAASALGAQLAAQLMAAYPDLRPETIRALIVHSAEWTEAMRQAYAPAASPTRSDYVRLVRHCGWGTPNLERACWSADNSLTLVIEDQVHPFKKDKKRGVVTRDMNLHAIPWPREALLALQDARVELRVTLSYFIEPNPSARGATSKFHYPSHKLRFEVQRPLETRADFVSRINAAAEREDDHDPINPKDKGWLLGDKQRHKGSMHQDVWRGTAAELANRGHIGIYPTNGWWRTRPKQERFDLPARYSLIVSIRTDRADVDLYTPVAQQIANRVPVVIQ